jgi:hypothetical protein
MLYVLSDRGWPVMAFRPPTDPRFTVLAVFREDDQPAALRLLADLARRSSPDKAGRRVRARRAGPPVGP